MKIDVVCCYDHFVVTVSEFSVQCLLEHGDYLATEQGVRAGDHEHSLGVGLELGGSKWTCGQGQSCPGSSCLLRGPSLSRLTPLPPVPSPPPLVSYHGVASGARSHHCTGTFGVTPKWQALVGWQAVHRQGAHRGQAEGFGALPSAGTDL